MRRVLVALLLPAVLLSTDSYAAQTAPELGALTVQLADLPPDATLYAHVDGPPARVAHSSRYVWQTYELAGLTRGDVHEFRFRSSTSALLLAYLGLYDSVAAAHRAYAATAAALSYALEAIPATLPLGAAGDERSGVTTKVPRAARPAIVVFRRGAYVLTLQLIPPRAGYSIGNLPRLLSVVDARIQHAH